MTPAERKRIIHRKLLVNFGPDRTDALERMMADNSVTITIERGVLKVSSVASVAPLIAQWMQEDHRAKSKPPFPL